MLRVYKKLFRLFCKSFCKSFVEGKVDVLNETLMNIFGNYIPDFIKTLDEKKSMWLRQYFNKNDTDL